MMLQVIMRFVFSSSLSWAEEVSVQLYIASVFMSISYCIRNKKMLRVEILASMFPQKIQHILGAVTELFNIVVWGYLVYASFGTIEALQRTNARLPATRLPQYIMYYVFMIALGLAAIRSIQILIQYVKPQKEPGGEKV